MIRIISLIRTPIQTANSFRKRFQQWKAEEEIVLVTDSGYDGQDNIALAKEKHVKLVATALIGK